VWDVSKGTHPVEVATRELGNGQLFTMQFSEDIPWTLACGGSKGELGIWDISENKNAEKVFGKAQ
jgi:periodic tryptophan protein 1